MRDSAAGDLGANSSGRTPNAWSAQRWGARAFG